MSTILLIGNTGVGKSTLGCALTNDSHAFITGYSPESVTSDLSIKTATINGKSLSVIDSPGLNDSQCTDEQILKKTVKFLNSQAKQINVVALVFNFQAPRFDESCEKLMKLYIAMINDVNFYSQICIVFSRCSKLQSDSDSNGFESRISNYNKSFPTLVRKCYTYVYEADNKIVAKIMSFANIPCFFMDCKSSSTEQHNEMNRLINFIFETPGRDTSHLMVPDHAKFKMLKKEQRQHIGETHNDILENGLYTLSETTFFEERIEWECWDKNYQINDDWVIINKSTKITEPVLLNKTEGKWVQTSVRTSRQDGTTLWLLHSEQKIDEWIYRNPNSKEVKVIKKEERNQEKLAVLKKVRVEPRESLKETKTKESSNGDIVTDQIYIQEERIVWRADAVDQIIYGEWKTVSERTAQKNIKKFVPTPNPPPNPTPILPPNPIPVIAKPKPKGRHLIFCGKRHTRSYYHYYKKTKKACYCPINNDPDFAVGVCGHHNGPAEANPNYAGDVVRWMCLPCKKKSRIN